ncbi:MAG: 7TM diverse intracellular signaling domain-containing protein [Ramlibacter sp.]
MAHQADRTGMHRPMRRALRGLLLLLCLWIAGPQTWATASGDFITTQTSFWIDRAGRATLDEVRQLPADTLQPLGQSRSFELDRGALWLRFDTPALDASRRWYLMLEGAAFTDSATFYQRAPGGEWTRQDAGDHLPVAAWSHPDRTPVFELDAAAGGTVWLRLENHPAPLSPSLQLLDAQDLRTQRDQSLLLLGGYLGFVLLVLFLGGVHVQLYGDRVFVAYVSYVACMLGFQLAFTGLGGLFFWPTLATWNNAAPALFMLWLTASGIWFVREVAAVQRHHRGLHRFMTGWSLFGFIYPALYFLMLSPAAFKLLNLYGLLSVLLSMAVCIWAWRKGEVYAGWTALGFLPLHLAYPFPALRSAGVLPDSWATQYAVLIGSAIEIPLLLYILHRRAKDFNENRARMRVIDSTDPLTGLTILPVLLLRLADTLRRARRNRGECALVLVDLSNHADIVASGGREMGERALVVAASQLSQLVRDVDTVCRVADTRFAILLETPYKAVMLKLLAQHIIARGLAGAAPLPLHLSPRFRVVTIALPEQGQGEPAPSEADVALLLDRLHQVLDQLEPHKVVAHLPVATPASSQASQPARLA